MKTRGFEIISGFEEIADIPKRSTQNSAGYDIKSAQETYINSGEIAVIPTGIKAYMSNDEVLKIHIRSSLGIKRNLTLANQVGIIDSDYYGNPDNDGHILIAIKNNSDENIIINAGERIAQCIFEKYLPADIDDVLNTKRIGGIGSTGK